MAGRLAGLRVIVTRPAHQAEALCRLLEAHGAEAARLPLFAIEPCGDPAAQSAQLAAARDCDGWIFTSANAARLAGERLSGAWPRLYAVGGATAQALAEAGHEGALTPAAGSSSEALLERAELQDVQGRHYVIVTGEDGRTLLADTLRARGASVDVLVLYRRRPLDYEAERLASEIALADATVLTSAEALERLWAITPEPARSQLLRHKLVVPSARVQEQAVALGFDAPLLPPELSDEAIVGCLLQWRGAPAAPTNPPPAAEMPETAEPSAAAPPAPSGPPPAAAPRRAGAVLAWMLVLLLAAALGYGGWLLWELRENQRALLQAQDEALRRLSRQAADLENETARLSTRQSDMARVLQNSSSDLAAIQARLDHNEALLGRLTEALQGGLERFQLASVEQLLLTANDRLLLERDVGGALLALQMADERLAQLQDPRLFKVREAIAQERAALQALPRPDLTSAALTVASLIERAGSLPLRVAVAHKDFAPAQRARSEAAGFGAWPERLWESLKLALSSLFTVRRDDNARVLRLLPPEQEALIHHVLVLKLEGARVALLRGDGQGFREATRSAAAWLREYFRGDDPGVLAALAELERLQPLQLSAPPPDISGSLGLLRAQLESSPQ